MKFRLTKAEWDAMETADARKVMYVLQADGSYQLPLLDYVDPAPLRNALDREREEARVAKEKVTTLEAEVTTLKKDTPKDVQTLRTAHDNEIKTLKDTTDGRIKTLQGELEKRLIDSTVNDLASQMTGTPQNAEVMKPHLASRVTVVWEGDVPTVKVKATNGTVGNALDDATKTALKKEFVENPVFGAIVVVSKASGGGAAGASSGAAGSAGASGGVKALKDMSGAERTALYQADPKAFNELVAADKAAQRESAMAPRPPLVITR